ncbi:lysoplasmalogenase [Belliella pelovolcani]|uniref:YhhN-like protein n=1 Tax=Belliella pelovolcani TaxID=529505 RepID=A0A1N7PGQ1_9BACT|nr:lysoplasmalogenase family protein [Belliella pelovolcani]SIT09815.1 YhhN-like protein [Belliella pelovolcani]
MKGNKLYNTIFIIVSAVSISFLFMDLNIGFYVTKPLIVPVLLVFLFLKFKEIQHPLIPLLMVATFFSFLGDIFLMITLEEALFKLLGICTFIIAQASYGVLYAISIKHKNKKIISWKQRWPEALALIITLSATGFVYPSLGDFVVPGVIYALVTVFTIIFALNRRFYVSKKSYTVTLMGVFSFFMSDALMGDDLFFTRNFTLALVMIFYVIGHYFVINGMMMQIEKEAKKAPFKDAFPIKN